MPRYHTESREYQQQRLDKINRQNEIEYQRNKNNYLQSVRNDAERIKEENSLREARTREEIAIAEEETEQWRQEQARKEEEKLQLAVDKAKSGKTPSIKVHQLYDEAKEFQSNGDKIKAAQTFWTAMICGEKRAAYELFKIFYNGDGVARNENLGKTMLMAAQRLEKIYLEKVKEFNPSIHQNLAGLVLSGVCNKAFRTSEGYVTDEIKEIQFKRADKKTEEDYKDFGNEFSFKPHTILECCSTKTPIKECFAYEQNYYMNLENGKVVAKYPIETSYDANQALLLHDGSIQEQQPYHKHYDKTADKAGDSCCCVIM